MRSKAVVHGADFASLVDAIERTHEHSATQAARAVNIHLTLRNWLIGWHISVYELNGADRAVYGDRLLEALSSALRDKGVSNTGKRQLYGYLAFHRTYPEIVRTASAQSFAHSSGGQSTLPVLEAGITKVRTPPALSPPSAVDPEMLLTRLSYSHFEQLVELDPPVKRLFYEVETLRGHWSVRELKRQIATQYFERSGLSTDKEALARLTHERAEAAEPRHVIRDPYVFEFLGLRAQEVMTERRLEDALLDRLQAFLIELGHGFCFEARQKRLSIGGEHCFVDLVFYHRVLKCHVLVELKNDAFRHEHLGQLNAYVSWYREHEMTEGDQPPVGILLCTRKNHEMVRYALAGMANRLFVSRYQLQLPATSDMEGFLRQALEDLSAGERS